MSEYLGARRVTRSAFAVGEAEKLTIYLGVCERDNRQADLDEYFAGRHEVTSLAGPPGR